MRILAENMTAEVGNQVLLQGWVHKRRDHGGLIFIDVRDHTGTVQVVTHPDHQEPFRIAESLRDEFVVEVSGEVRERPVELQNENSSTGTVELVASAIRILNKSEALPIQPFGDNMANEELRLKYRFLDLRRPKMQTMLRKRAQYLSIIRQFMEGVDFIEVATPILANSSPEGARDFLIPSRVHQGKYYALPQAPQQFKQLLMVGGLPRYYQIAACFRDEDPRADRLYGEFYQLDLEMSFVEDGDIVRKTLEPLIVQLVTEFAGKELIGGTDAIQQIAYRDAMDRFGTDKPDLRFGMELVDVSDVFNNTEFGVFKNALNLESGVIKAICVPGGARLSRKQIDHFTDIAKSEGAGGLAYLLFDDEGPRSPIAKFLSNDEIGSIRDRLGANNGDAVFFASDKKLIANKVLGRLRNDFADEFDMKDPSKVALAWIIDFPFYEWDEKSNKLDFGHNPFSMPKGGLAALESTEDKLSILADQYDMVMNGYEICSGGVRNHNPEVLYKAFELLGFSNEYVDERFGAMVNAFKFGAPPHAGCAFGLDRMLMELLGESNIREIVAFPKNGSGVDVMMGSPSVVDKEQLKELGL